MHILTKAFMVIATLLSVALSALVIAYAANTDKIRQDYSEVKVELEATKAALSAGTSTQSQQIVRLEQQVGDLTSRLSDANSKVTALQDERATLQRDKAQAVADKTSAESKISEQTEVARTQATLLTNLGDEVRTLRKNELVYKQRQLEMEDRLNDLQAQRDVLDQNYRALQEELAQLKQGTTTTVAGGGAATAPYQYTGPVIMGKVESVQRDPGTNRTLAKLSIGSNDRVAKNMLMRVVRNNQFIANVVVTQADLSYSIGAVDTLGKQVEVREGDTVVSRLQ
ncbi:MAG TPA: hypothetical protein VHN77_04600 [Phycisphaerales bacterium]|nr:hypothetical protein [Phycisphaerales bacterium]